MAIVTKLFALGMLAWFAALALLVTLRMLRNDIRTRGVLVARGEEDTAPERALAMAVFPAILGYYVITALHANLAGPTPSLPDIPDQLVTLLTGSNSLYLAGKIARAKGGPS